MTGSGRAVIKATWLQVRREGSFGEILGGVERPDLVFFKTSSACRLTDKLQGESRSRECPVVIPVNLGREGKSRTTW